jgi:hypothetical protein
MILRRALAVVAGALPLPGSCLQIAAPLKESCGAIMEHR